MDIAVTAMDTLINRQPSESGTVDSVVVISHNHTVLYYRVLYQHKDVTYRKIVFGPDEL